MADSREFVLIGRFDDQITGSLEKINNSLNSLKKNLGSFGARKGGFNDLTKSMGKVISAHKRLSDEVANLRSEMRASIPVMREYRKELGKTVSGNMMLQGKGKKQKFSKATNPTLQFLEAATKQTRQLAQASKGVRIGGRMPRGGGGGGYVGGGGGAGPRVPRTPSTPRPPRPPRVGGGGGGGYHRGLGHGGSFDMPAFAFGMTIGQGLSQPITMAIMSGFQLGVGLLQKGFEYVANSFSERVEDQMTDLQAAGGYKSISDRQKNPMFSSLQQAIMFTQSTNDVLERLAGDLPGSTEDYVKVSKRIGDSVMRLVDSNEKGAVQFARQLVEKGQLQESYRGVSLEGPNAREGATQVILGELTKKTVLAGFGGTTGRGGATGAYGLPALMERLITNPDTSMAQLQKYASVFGDPKIMSALDRAMPELEKAGSDMLARTKFINSMLDEVSPPEMISAMRKSMAGVLEAYRSAFFSPGTGLFGFGRKLKDASGKLQPLTDAYGRFIRMVEINGKQVEKLTDDQGNLITALTATQVKLDVFNMFADIISNYATILKPIVDNLYLIWDPMQGIADALRQARITSTEILKTFRSYTKGLEEFAKGISDKGLRDAFLSTKSFRATLLTLSNIFAEMGIFSDADFYKFQKTIIDPKTGMEGLGNVLKSFMDTFLKSDAATEVGKFLGTLVKEVVLVLADITTLGEKLGKSNLASGFVKGFGDEGFKALERLFTNLYDMIFSALGKVIEMMPNDIKTKILGYAMAGLGLVAGVAAIGMAIGSGLAVVFSGIAKSIEARLLGLVTKAPTNLFGSSRALYNLDKAKPTNFEALSGQTRTGTVKSPSGVLGKKLIRNKLFPQVAIGESKAMSIGGRYRAPSIPKMAGAKGMPVSIRSVAKNVFGRTGNFLKGVPGAMGAGGMAGLKNPFGMLGKTMSALTVFGGVINGLSTLLSGGSLWQTIGATAGPIIGTILGTALLGPLGGFIGGWIGQQEWITDTLGQAAEQMSKNIGGTFEQLGGLFTDLAAAINPLFGVSSELDKFYGLIVILKVALTPFVAAFMLLEQAMRGLRMILLQAQLEFARDGFFGLGKDPKKAAELQAKIAKLNAEGAAQVARDVNWFQTYKEGDKAVLGGQSVTRQGGKWVNAQNQEVKGSNATPPQSNPTMTSRNYTVGGITYDWRTGAPVSGVPKKGPSKPVGNFGSGTVGGGTLNAANLQGINQKAAVQIKETTSVKTSIEKTTTAVKQVSAQAAGIQSSLAAIYNMLAGKTLMMPGMIGVMGMPGMPGMPGAGMPGTPGLPGLLGGQDAWSRSFWNTIPTPKTNTVNPDNMRTSNSVGAGTGDIAINSPITIYQQPGQSTDELASIVAVKIGEAVADARASSIFV